MILSRRGILGLLGGAVSSHATGLRVKDLAARAHAGSAAGMVGGVVGGPSPSSHEDNPLWPLLWKLRRRRNEERMATRRDLPPHIASMKSWSPAYKAMIYRAEEAEIEAFEDALRGDSPAAIVKRLMAYG